MPIPQRRSGLSSALGSNPEFLSLIRGMKGMNAERFGQASQVLSRTLDSFASSSELLAARLTQIRTEDPRKYASKGQEAGYEVLSNVLKTYEKLKGHPVTQLGQAEQVQGFLKFGAKYGGEGLLGALGITKEESKRKQEANTKETKSVEDFGSSAKKAADSLLALRAGSHGLTQAFESVVSGRPQGVFSGLAQFAGETGLTAAAAFSASRSSYLSRSVGGDLALGVYGGGGGGGSIGTAVGGLVAGAGGAAGALGAAAGAAGPAMLLAAAGMVGTGLYKGGIQASDDLSQHLMARMGMIETGASLTTNPSLRGSLFSNKAYQQTEQAYAMRMGVGGIGGAIELRQWVRANDRSLRAMGYTDENLNKFGDIVGDMSRAFRTSAGGVLKTLDTLDLVQKQQYLQAFGSVSSAMQMQYAGYGIPSSMADIANSMIQSHKMDSQQAANWLANASQAAYGALSNPQQIAGLMQVSGLSQRDIGHALLMGDWGSINNATQNNLLNPTSAFNRATVGALSKFDFMPGTDEFKLARARMVAEFNPQLLPSIMANTKFSGKHAADMNKLLQGLATDTVPGMDTSLKQVSSANADFVKEIVKGGKLMADAFTEAALTMKRATAGLGYLAGGYVGGGGNRFSDLTVTSTDIKSLPSTSQPGDKSKIKAVTKGRGK